HGYAYRACAVGCGNAGLHALVRFDGHGEVGAVARAVTAGHQRKIQLTAAIFGESQADQATRMRDHEIDVFRRNELRRHDEIALVFAVFLVNEDHHAACAQLGHDFTYGGDSAGGCADFQFWEGAHAKTFMVSWLIYLHGKLAHFNPDPEDYPYCGGSPAAPGQKNRY